MRYFLLRRKAKPKVPYWNPVQWFTLTIVVNPKFSKNAAIYLDLVLYFAQTRSESLPDFASSASYLFQFAEIKASVNADWNVGTGAQSPSSLSSAQEGLLGTVAKYNAKESRQYSSVSRNTRYIKATNSQGTVALRQ